MNGATSRSFAVLLDGGRPVRDRRLVHAVDRDQRIGGVGVVTLVVAVRVGVGQVSRVSPRPSSARSARP